MTTLLRHLMHSAWQRVTRWFTAAPAPVGLVLHDALRNTDDDVADEVVLIEDAPSPLPVVDIAPVPHTDRASPAVLPPAVDVVPGPVDSTAPLWHFRSTILERLDEYFVCIRRLQRYDPDSYKYFARVGFGVAADVFVNGDNPDQRERLRTAPRLSMGGILGGGLAEETGFTTPAFVYFRKMTLPSGVAVAPDGDIYRLTCLYDDRDPAQRWRAHGACINECFVSLNHDGSVHLLKQRMAFDSRIVSRRKKGQRREEFLLTQTQWRYPAWLYQKQNLNGQEVSLTPEQWATGIFAMTLLTFIDTTSKIIVRVKRDEATAAFGIELPRAKYFFADRNLELAVDGRRKRIFHAVAQHTRTLSTDRMTQVRQHYRGLRHFDWKGYAVTIALPTRTSPMHFDAPASAIDDVPEAERAQWADSKKVGTLIGDALDV